MGLLGPSFPAHSTSSTEPWAHFRIFKKGLDLNFCFFLHGNAKGLNWLKTTERVMPYYAIIGLSLKFYQYPRWQDGSDVTYSWALSPFSKFLKKRFDFNYCFLLQGSPKGLNWNKTTERVKPYYATIGFSLKFYQTPRRQGTFGGIWRNLQLSPEPISEIFEKVFRLKFSLASLGKFQRG
jgi:hypothetical protein